MCGISTYDYKAQCYEQQKKIQETYLLNIQKRFNDLSEDKGIEWDSLETQNRI